MKWNWSSCHRARRSLKKNIKNRRHSRWFPLAQKDITGRFSFPLIFHWVIGYMIGCPSGKQSHVSSAVSRHMIVWGGGGGRVGPICKGRCHTRKNAFACRDRTPHIYWISVGFRWSSIWNEVNATEKLPLWTQGIMWFTFPWMPFFPPFSLH